MKNLNIILLGIIALLCTVSCKKEEPTVVACFTPSVIEANVGDEIILTNHSEKMQKH